MQKTGFRILAGMLTLAMLSTALGGCNSKKNPSNTEGSGTSGEESVLEEVRDFGGAEVIIGSHWATGHFFPDPGTSTEGDLILDRIEELENTYHCTFSYVTGSAEEFPLNFTTASAAGQKYADIIDANMYWWWGFQTAGYLEPLDDIQDLQLSDSIWYPLYTEVTKVDGKSYGVNWHSWYHKLPHAFYVLYFNQNILKDKNLESPYDLMEKGEWTWDNFRDLVKKADDQPNGIFGLGSMDRHLELGAIRSNGAREVIQDENGKFIYGLTDEKAYAALDFVREIIQTDKTFDMSCYDGRVAAVQWTDTIKNFCDGKYAFFAYHTDCLEFGGFLDSMDDDYGMVPFPKGPSGTSDYNAAITGDTVVCAIPVTADDVERSGFLLRKLAQPLEGTAADDWKNTALRKYFRDPEGFQQYLNIIEYRDSDYSWITGGGNMGAMVNAALQVTRDKSKTPAEAMESIASAFQVELDKYLNS